jgi:hypothetical protein
LHKNPASYIMSWEEICVNLHLILPFALLLAALAACFAGLFWRLASRFDAQDCTAEWLNRFSLESYVPMSRLLDKRDFEFLASQAGYRSEIGRVLMAERRKIFVTYLSDLVRDFNQLARIGRLMIVYSREDRDEFARSLWRRQMSFYAAVCSVWLQLALHPLGWAEADPHPLVAALGAMRSQVLSVASGTASPLGNPLASS